MPAVYEVLGLAKPDPSASIHTDEEAMFERFLEVWGATPDQDSLIRAARLMAQGTRAVMLGWTDLMDEQLAEPARQRLLRGELERFPDDVRVAFGKLTRLAPEMFLWLSGRYLEHRSVNGIVEGFERYLATRGLAPAPTRSVPPRSFSWTSPASLASRASAGMSPRSSRRLLSSATPMPPRRCTAAGS